MNGTFFNSPNFPEEMKVRSRYLQLGGNIGKKIIVYTSFPNSKEWQDKTFSGIIESSNNEELMLSDPSNGNWYLIPLMNINFIEFEEKINH